MNFDPRLLAVARRLRSDPILDHYKIHDISGGSDPTSLTLSMRPIIPGETWLPLPGFEEWYEISDLGRVKSRSRRVYAEGPRGEITERNYREKILRACIADVYPQVRLCKPIGPNKTSQRNLRVHKLVLTAFRGPRPDGLIGCHNNGIASDCRLVNLRWDTPKSNQVDRRKHAEEKQARIRRARYAA